MGIRLRKLSKTVLLKVPLPEQLERRERPAVPEVLRRVDEADAAADAGVRAEEEAERRDGAAAVNPIRTECGRFRWAMA
jgi:hypothetical protein